MSNRTVLPGQWLAPLLELILPQDCLLCGDRAGAALLCPPCVASLPWAQSGQCEVCALPGGGPRCGRCQAGKPAFERTVAVFDYAFPVDVLVQAFKYRGELALAGLFGAMLAERAAPLLASADLIVPMPLHPLRLRERGFNQAVELARPLARFGGLALEFDRVRKLRHTPPQATLARAQRLRSPRAAFACEADLRGRHVVVVDDVMTTGASADALARALKAAGAIEVSNVVVARTAAPR